MIRAQSRLANLGTEAGVDRYHNYSVVGLGDSLTYGYGGEDVSGPYTPYLDQLDTYMEWRPYVNLGVSGETSTQILARWVLATQYYDYTVINWSGRNDISAFGTGWSTTTIANLDSFVAIQQAAGNDRYVLFGVTNNGSENPTIGGTGTTNYNAIVAHNAACASRYGAKFFDIREWMVNDALDALGLTPTADDLADIALDMIPRQLRRDATNVHFNNVGNRAIAYKVAELIEAMDASAPVNVMTFPNLASLQGDGSISSGEYLTAYDGLKLGDPGTGGGLLVSANPRQKTLFVGFGSSLATAASAATTRELVFVGQNAGGTVNTGRANTGVGADVAVGLTSGGFNTLAGTRAGNLLTEGNSNTLIGVDAGAALTTQSGFVAVGRYALQTATGSNPNTGIGFQALYLTSSGGYNTAVGYQAGRANTTGNSNVAIGDAALKANETGGNNVAIGRDALTASTVNNNVAVGNQAMAANVDGTTNVAIGGSALSSATTSDENVAIGYQALFNSTDTVGKNNLIGYQAGRTNTTGAGNVGVGHSVLYTNSTSNNNVAIGNSALYLATSANNIAIGHSAGDNITTGARNIVIGQGVDAPSATADNRLTIGNLIYGTDVDGTGTTDSTGNVGIGGSPGGAGGASAKLDVFGDKIRLRTSKTPSSASDTGNAGDICWDADYIYVATGTGAWKRVAIATWP
jgi:hypothetical protein